MRCYVFRVAGVIVGALGGAVGAVLGLLVGYLLDLIVAELILVRAVRRAMIHNDKPRARTLGLPIVSASVVVKCVYGGHLAEMEYPPVVDAMHDVCSGLTRRQLERVVATVASVFDEDADEPRLHPASLCGVIERETALAVCDVVAAGELRDSALSGAARYLGLPASAAGRFLGQPRLDPESCRILGVEQSATWSEVRSSYRLLAAQFHPDTMTELSPARRKQAEEAFVRIQSAYDALAAQLRVNAPDDRQG
jgi:hypothetical protein